MFIETYRKEDLELLVKKEAWVRKLPETIMLAIVKVESDFNPFAVRYEPYFKYVEVIDSLKPKNCSNKTEIQLQKTSWGLFQIMGATARYLGFSGWLTKLLIPEINVKYGTLYFARLYRQYGRKYGIAGAVAAYNAGSPKLKDGTGEFVNQKYVNKVMEHARNWH